MSETRDDEVLLCRCQEVTRGDIRRAILDGARSLREIKLRTEAMMGLCQGRTCSRRIAREISVMTGIDESDLLPREARAPVRPVPLAALEGSDPASDH